mgnify:FL=1|tara:strand:+ start:88 stop:369 length:282 start_codon:yes stop_codon:yes gene_type:complete
MNEIAQKNDIRRANEARALMSNDILSDAFDEVERQYLDAMLTATEKDDLGRFRFSEAIKVVRLVKQQLAIAISNGELSSHELTMMSGKRRSFF